MRTLLSAALCATCSFVLTACITMVSPVINTTDLANTNLSYNFKKGQSCQTYVLVFGPFGDASIVAAARNGKISTAKVVDYEIRNYLLASQRCVIVHGE